MVIRVCPLVYWSPPAHAGECPTAVADHANPDSLLLSRQDSQSFHIIKYEPSQLYDVRQPVQLALDSKLEGSGGVHDLEIMY